MVQTFVLFFLPFFLLSFLDICKSHKQNYELIYFLSIIYVLFFSSLLVEYSGDFVNYKDSFINVNSWNEYLAGSTIKGYAFEPGFLAIYFFVKNLITQDAHKGITIITLLAGGGLLYFIPKYTRYVFIALLVYIAHFYWWLGIVLLRQICAMVILFPLLSLLRENKWKKAAILIGCAALFHASALIFYVFLFARKINLFKNGYRNFILIFLAFLFGYMDIIKIVLSFLGGFIPRGDVLIRYISSTSGRSMNVLAYVEMLFILYAALKYRNKLQFVNKYTDIGIEFLIWSLLIGALFYHYEIGTRFTMYFNFYSYLILLSSFVAVFKRNVLNKSLYICLLGTYMCVFLVRFIYITL